MTGGGQETSEQIASVVLAAGAGRRFGGRKQLATLRGRPLLEHALAVAAAGPADTIVVAGGEREIGTRGARIAGDGLAKKLAEAAAASSAGTRERSSPRAGGEPPTRNVSLEAPRTTNIGWPNPKIHASSPMATSRGLAHLTPPVGGPGNTL
ncbi:MAG: NTP transferase domain-containing protein [Actinobacteria bacterium]|nr:NTP transferase domain-containing protein [Actinomycetota bacterium]